MSTELCTNAHTITTMDDAIRAGEGCAQFREKPGDVVIGATQGAGCFGAAYEFLFNTSYQLKKAGLKDRVKLTYVSAEPFLGHFGIGGLPHGETLLGMFLEKEGIDTVLDTAMDHVDEGRLVLADGRTIDFGYAMIIPPFSGQEVVRKVEAISDDNGFVKVRDTYQSEAYDDLYAVGVAAAVEVRGRRRRRWASPRPASRPSSRPTRPRSTSPPRSGARSRRSTRRSATSRRCA